MKLRPLKDPPYLSVSESDMRWNHTGSWRHLRPSFDGGMSPCNEGCPAGTDVRGFLAAAARGDFDEARRVILRCNPMPGVTGRVCDHPCEISCNRTGLDECVGVQSIERAIDEYAGHEVVLRPASVTRKKVAVIGSGPAGLSCAYHLTLKGHRVTVFEGESVLGGVLRFGIPAYRLPRKVLAREIEFIARCGVQFKTGQRLGENLAIDDLSKFDAVFMATGAHRSTPLDVNGAVGRGVGSAMAFLKAAALRKKVSPGKIVAVIGGGNTAIDAARTALRLGSHVYVVYRRTRSEMPAIAEEVDHAMAEGVGFEFLAAPLEILRSRTGSISGLLCQRMRLGAPDADGRRRPVPVRGKTFVLRIDAVLAAIGEWPDESLIPREYGVGENGIVQVDEFAKTKVDRFFAGGDLAGGQRTVAHAIGSGRRAANAIDKFLQGRTLVTEQAASNTTTPDRINPLYFEKSGRHKPEVVVGKPGLRTFNEVRHALDRGTAVVEAGRCFSCGKCINCDICFRFCPDVSILRNEKGYSIDLDHCKGCGICATECPRGVITMHPEREAAQAQAGGES